MNETQKVLDLKNERRMENTRDFQTKSFEFAKGGDISYFKTLIKLANDYPIPETWNAIKTTVDESSNEIFLKSDIMELIEISNNAFPNENRDISFQILYVINKFVSELMTNPFDDLLKNEQFYKFFEKLPFCFTPQFELRSIVTAADIVQVLSNECPEKIEDDNTIIERYDNSLVVFSQILKNIICLLKCGQFNEFFVSQMINTLDSLRDFIEECEIQDIYAIYMQSIFPISSISSYAIKALSNILEKFPSLYTVIASNSDNLQILINLLSEETFNCVQYSAKILDTYIKNPETASILFQMDIVNALFKNCTKSKVYANILFPEIVAMCNAMPDACSLFLQLGIIDPKYINFSVKSKLSILQIVHTSLKYGILQLNEEMLEVCLNLIEQSLESDDEEMILISLDIIPFLSQNASHLKLRNELEQLTFGEFNDKIAITAQALLKSDYII